MKLAVGKIASKPSTIDGIIADEILFTATENTDVTFLQFNNESDADVVINVFIDFTEERIRLLPLDTTIKANEMIRVEDITYSLVADERIVAKVDTNNVITYLINGNSQS